MNRYKALILIGTVLAATHQPCDAGIIINADEVGNDVVFTGAGTLDIDDLILTLDYGTEIFAEVQSGNTDDGPILGMTPGSYVWTWGSGVNADSLTLNVTAVPEPSSALAWGFLGAIVPLVKRRRSQPDRHSRMV